MSDSLKDGRRGGGHKNTQGREYWKSRLHKHGELIGRQTKKLTHRAERHGKRTHRALRDAELLEVEA